MTGLFIKVDYNNVFFSTARSMARFGLLMLNKGTWNTTPVLSDTAYFNQMTNSSQSLNLSYGYLTWLNGKSSLMVPQSQITFPTSLSPDAPRDMYAALGKNGQIINVVPQQGLVVIRMGNNPDNLLVPFTYNNEIWKRLNPVICTKTSTTEKGSDRSDAAAVVVYPNPFGSDLTIDFGNNNVSATLKVVNALGQVIKTEKINNTTLQLPCADLPKGVYWIHIENGNNKWVKKVIKG